MNNDQHKITACTSKGKRCTAIDSKRKQWLYDAQNEAEAQLMVEAVVDRGYILPKWWRPA